MNAVHSPLARRLLATSAILAVSLAANFAAADPTMISTVYEGKHIFPRTAEQYESKLAEYRQLEAQLPTINHYLEHGNAEQQQWAQQMLNRGRQFHDALSAQHTFLKNQVLPTKLVCYNSAPPAYELDRFFTLLRRDMGAQGKTYVWNGREFLVTDGEGRVFQVDQEIRKASAALPQKQNDLDVDAIADKSAQIAKSHEQAAAANRARNRSASSGSVTPVNIPVGPIGAGGTGALGQGE